MDERALRGIPWTFLAYASNRAITLLSTFVLARLLVPADFGIFTFASISVVFLGYFATLGLAPALVVRQDLRREQMGTALSLLVATNVLAACALAAFAPLVSEILDESSAGGVLLVLAATAALTGFAPFYSAILQRELLFRRHTLCQAAQVLTMAATSIPLAALDAGVWSLAAGYAAGTLVYATMLVALAPYHVRPSLDGATARSLWGSGRGFMLQGGLSFTEQNADYFILGSALGSRELGAYSMAFRISELPYSAIVDPVSQATFPGYARMREEGQDVRRPFLTSLRLAAFCAFPLGLIASGAAEPLVEALLGDRWTAAIGLIAVLGVWGSLRTIQGAIGWFVNSVGFSWYIGLAYGVLLVITIPVLIVAATASGAEAVAWVLVANVTATLVIVATIARTKVGVPLRDQWRAVQPSVLASVPAWAATRAVAETTTDMAPAAGLALAVAAGTTAYAAVILLVAPDLPAEARRQGRRMTARSQAA